VTAPLEKLDAQTVDNQHRMPFQFLRSLHPFGRGWEANQSPANGPDAGLNQVALGHVNRAEHPLLK
jgi:hypothetical protein